MFPPALLKPPPSSTLPEGHLASEFAKLPVVPFRVAMFPRTICQPVTTPVGSVGASSQTTVPSALTTLIDEPAAQDFEMRFWSAVLSSASRRSASATLLPVL